MKLTTIDARDKAPRSIAGAGFKHVLCYQSGRWTRVQADEIIGEYEGVLHGIPALHKDNIEEWLEKKHWADI